MRAVFRVRPRSTAGSRQRSLSYPGIFEIGSSRVEFSMASRKDMSGREDSTNQGLQCTACEPVVHQEYRHGVHDGGRPEMGGRRLLLDRFCGTFSLPVEIQADLSVPDE